MKSVIEQASPARPLTARNPFRPFPAFSFGKLVVFVVLAALSILFLIPFFWMLSTSLKDVRDTFDGNWIPKTIVLSNYTDAFSYGEWAQWTFNTVLIAFFQVVGVVLSTSLVAYAFARLRWPGRNVVFALVLATLMLPGVVTMIPKYILFSQLPSFGFMGSPNWINTFLPFIVPAFTGDSFYIFLVRQFMRGIPMELSEAARIDGASEIKIWWVIVMPLTKPALAAVAIFAFQNSWEDFMGPLLYLNNEHLYTLQLGLRQFEFAAGGAPQWSWLMAASLAVMAPMIIIFLLFQRYFIEGVTLTGMGGR